MASIQRVKDQRPRSKPFGSKWAAGYARRLCLRDSRCHRQEKEYLVAGIDHRRIHLRSSGPDSLR